MKQVINIRLGHYVLTADDDAAQLVGNYTDILKKQYAGVEGGNEIVEDIEERIGELLAQKQTNASRTFSTLEDVQEVLQQIGPAQDEPSSDAQNTLDNNPPARKRFFRDPDSKILGGVCGGMGAYFDTDPLVFRLLWIASVFVFGFGVPLYIVLWVIVPEAGSTAEKLMMRGQAPTRKNIEENVKAEIYGVSERLKKGNSALDSFSSILGSIFKVIATVIITVFKIAGWFIAVILIMVLISGLLAVTTDIGSISTPFLEVHGNEGINELLGLTSINPIWVKVTFVGFLLLAIASITLKALSFNGKRPEIRTSTRVLGIGTFVLFFLCFAFVLSGISRMRHQQFKQGDRQKLDMKGDTIYLSSSNIDFSVNGMFLKNHLEEILTSPDSNFYIEQSVRTFNSPYKTAREYSAEISQNYTFKENVLTLQTAQKYGPGGTHGLGNIRYNLYVPAGKVVKVKKDWYFNNNNYSSISGPSTQYTMSRGGFLENGTHSNKVSISNELDKIVIEGNFEVKIVQDNANYVELINGPIVANSDWVEVRGNELHIELEGTWDNFKKSVVKIHTKSLRRLELSGASHATFGDWKGGDLEITCEGASGVNGQLTAHNVDLDIEGAGESTLQGRADNLEISISGAGAFLGSDFECKQVTLDMSGACKAQIWATSTVEGKANGASQIDLKGNPKDSRIRTEGASTFHRI
jgi:phage shock protein C